MIQARASRSMPLEVKYVSVFIFLPLLSDVKPTLDRPLLRPASSSIARDVELLTAARTRREQAVAIVIDDEPYSTCPTHLRLRMSNAESFRFVSSECYVND